jgi:hypothetical protein
MNYNELLYIDIETAGKYPDLETLKDNDIRGYELFLRKLDRKGVQYTDWKEDPNSVYLSKSSLIPEFGRVVCVSMAIVKDDKVQMISVCDEDEQFIIEKVHKTLMKFSYNTLYSLCGYYIKGFDIPWLNRKFLEYGLQIPKMLQAFNVKPWEMSIVDIADVWKSNGTLESVSFDEMLYTLGIESPKSVIAGKDVHNCFWVDKNLNKIKTYCEADVMSCVKAAKKIMPLL